MIKQNLHTHSIFSDGENTLEEMALAAISKGFSSLGFSDHSAIKGCEDWCMPREKYAEYFLECERIKEKFEGKLEIFIGLEMDVLSEKCEYPLDYAIGSCHHVVKNKKRVCIDNTPEELIEGAKDLFNGDMLLLCEEYYDEVGRIAERDDLQIVGHFDIITKHIEVCKGIVDVTSERFIEAENKALDKLIKAGKIFEINTGAMARGKRTLPYPSERVLKQIAKAGGRITISSDCHDADFLDCGFDECLTLAKKCGFGEIYYLECDGFKAHKF
ncbi:MAG: histidinol-phosphatase [Oscillospiraceae bacterium]|nr:histidinol-phosphatase [Oscillospiraceae bacterium]